MLSGEVRSSCIGACGANNAQANTAAALTAPATTRFTGARTQNAAIPRAALAQTAARIAPSYLSAGIRTNPAASDPTMAPTVFQAYTRALAGAASSASRASTRTASG